MSIRFMVPPPSVITTWGLQTRLLRADRLRGPDLRSISPVRKNWFNQSRLPERSEALLGARDEIARTADQHRLSGLGVEVLFDQRGFIRRLPEMDM
jgi:hypothetical protein